jgi:ribonuclease HII
MPTSPYQPPLPRDLPPPAPHPRHPAHRRAGWPTRRRELQLWAAGQRRVVGLDEVGRGPIAGPVVAGAVCLAPRSRPDWLGKVRDSKQLSARARRELSAAIKHTVPGWGVGWAAAEEIDSVGILQGTRLAMRRALADLAARAGAPADYVLVDGRDAHHFECAFETIVGGDASCTSIAAASVVAKVARDAWMETRAAAYPGYGFAANKGYATPGHLRALRRLGPCAEHRQAFAPVRANGRAALRPAPARHGF